MPPVIHIIVAISVLNINVVVVVPACWPFCIVTERIAAVLEAVIPADHPGMPHVERVVPTEMGTVIGVRDAAIVAATAVATAALSPLCVFPPLGVFLPLRVL
jgi:hypothetical protein